MRPVAGDESARRSPAAGPVGALVVVREQPTRRASACEARTTQRRVTAARKKFCCAGSWSTVTFPSLTSLANLTVSARMRAAISPGVSPIGSAPIACMRCAKSGDLMIFTISAFSLLTTSFGVAAGVSTRTRRRCRSPSDRLLRAWARLAAPTSAWRWSRRARAASALNVLKHRRDRVEGHRHLPAQQVGGQRAAAPVRHMQQPGAGAGLELGADQVLRRALPFDPYASSVVDALANATSSATFFASVSAASPLARWAPWRRW